MCIKNGLFHSLFNTDRAFYFIMRAYHARFSSRCQEFSTYPKDRKKNFSTAKNFFPHSFFGKISDFHKK